MITLTKDQADALAAFLDAFDQHVTGAWPAIEEAMRDDYGFDDPEAILEEAREALRK